MQINYFTADVFTKRRFSGAQIAVVPDANGINKEQMQKITQEFNLSETVFVTEDLGENKFQLKLFSPQSEVGFGSHTTVATAHVLASIGKIDLSEQHTPVTFCHESGDVLAHVTHEDNKPLLTQFTLTTEPTVDHYVPAKAEFADILSLNSSALEHKTYAPKLVSNKGLYLIVPVKTYQQVRDAIFSPSAWSASQAPSMLAQNILIFTTNTEESGADFHLRLLGPQIGVNEDPPVGSAIPAFSAFLCAHKHIAKGTYNYTVERGTSESRQSHLDIEMDNKQSDTLTLRVGGSAVIVCEGKIQLDE